MGYLMMNEKKPKWVCPVCNKAAYYENLLIDGYFSEVLNSKKLPRGEHEIVLQNDASWDPLVIPKKKDEKEQKDQKETKKEKVETLDLDDDENDAKVKQEN